MNNLRKTLLIICSIFAFAYGVWAQTPVTVPSVSLADYQSASDWSAFTNMQYMETLTVYDGTTTKNTVPAYIFYFDDFTRSQFVIPANDLVEMVGSSITSMTFYTTSSDMSYTTVSPADVYLMEVSYTSISAYEPKLSATIVYSGFFNIVSTDNGGEMTINFSTPFAYQGGNLLVGIENTVDVDEGYKDIIFYGQTVTGASISGYDSSSLDDVPSNQRDFIPKTTFGFTPACEPKSLPYSYGFEDPGEFDCWTKLNCHNSSAINSSAAHQGNDGFRFHYNTTPPQYLISPKFEGASGMDVSFYYKNASNDWPETFQVGYSTTTKSPNAFVWGEEVTANDQNTWQLYKKFFPIGTKYVAIKLTSNDQYYLYLDNFNFEPAFCADEDKCELTFTLTDSYGDGWNDNAIRVVDVKTGVVLATLANEDLDNGSGEETQTITLPVCDGRELRFEWVSGQWPDECSYTVTDNNGIVVFTGSNVMSEAVNYTIDCSQRFVFLTDGDWNDGDNWNIGEVPEEGSDVIIQADAVIPAGYTAYAWDVTLNGGSITVEDGGQLVHGNAGLAATVKKEITGVGDSWSSVSDGWHFIASPIVAENGINPQDVSYLIGMNFDLYRLNGTIWENAKAHENDFFLENGIGYLYANKNTVSLGFTGELKPYSEANHANEVSVDAGWNLIGNPFVCNVYANQPFYKMNAEGTAIEAVENYAANAIAPCTGIVINAAEAGAVTFTRNAPSMSNNNGNIQIALAQASNTRGNAIIDNAIVSFNEGTALPKFRFGDNAEIYIPQGNEDYAIVSTEAQGELPLNFKARENGTYTLTVSETANFQLSTVNYLHLIDNMTGADIDLLSQPAYTFQAKTTDYASRFRLVFARNEANNDNEPFAFISNGEIIINGTGTLQVIDLLGHVLITDDVNSAFRIPHSAFSTGVYVLRLINGENVRTQKIVID